MQKSKLKREAIYKVNELFTWKMTDEEWLLKNFGYIVIMFMRIIKEVQEGQKALDTEELQDKNSLIHLHDNILNALNLLGLFTIVIPHLKMAEELLKVKQLVHEFVMIDTRVIVPSPLHLACSLAAPYINIPTIHLLLECGAPVDARDNDGNTALHIAAMRHKQNPSKLNVVIQSLLKKGAHPDSGNKDKQTFYDISGIPMHETHKDTDIPFSLKCLAARVVRKHDLPVELGSVPVTLQNFVLNH